MLIFLNKKKKHTILVFLITINIAFTFNIYEIAAFHLNELETTEECQETYPLMRSSMKKDQVEESTEAIQSKKKGCGVKLIECLKRIFLRGRNIEGQHKHRRTTQRYLYRIN